MTTQITMKSVLSALVLLLGACSAKEVVIQGDYPVPSISPLPLTVGVYYDDSLTEFTHTEVDETSGKEQFIIQTGRSQPAMFNNLLQGTFSNVVQVDSLENVQTEYPQVDVVFVPLIEEFQLGLPEKTRLNSYEVWIKYNMRLSELDGTQIADWVMTAYGKSPSELSDGDGITNAANQALRDLAASFALGVRDVPDVRDWLAARSPASD